MEEEGASKEWMKANLVCQPMAVYFLIALSTSKRLSLNFGKSHIITIAINNTCTGAESLAKYVNGALKKRTRFLRVFVVTMAIVSFRSRVRLSFSASSLLTKNGSFQDNNSSGHD